jgi:hypothetical protein
MKKVMVLAAALSLTLLVGKGFADDMGMKSDDMHKDMKMDKAMSSGKGMKCEVVDVACYIQKGAKGEDHQACAAKCISGGGELALLHNGKLYIPVDANYHSERDKFVSKGGEMVEVTGKAVSKGGLNYLVLDEDKKAE